MQQFPILIESFRHSHCNAMAPDDFVFDEGGVVGVVVHKEHTRLSDAKKKNGEEDVVVSSLAALH